MEFKVFFGIFLISVGLFIFCPKILEYLGYESQRNLWAAQMFESGNWVVEEVVERWGGVRLFLSKDGLSHAINHQKKYLDIDCYHPDFSLVASAQVGNIILFEFQEDPIVGIKKKISAYLRLTKIPVGIVA